MAAPVGFAPTLPDSYSGVLLFSHSWLLTKWHGRLELHQRPGDLEFPALLIELRPCEMDAEVGIARDDLLVMSQTSYFCSTLRKSVIISS